MTVARGCDCGCTGIELCGCCEGLEPVTPLATAAPAGLAELPHRVGTHGTFVTTMKARLSSVEIEGRRPLATLTTRAESDPSIAFLDAWSAVADVLTFYQERLVNEGYLRTASERRSVAQLARLLGYRLRPGVAAGVYLAFTLEDGYDVKIPEGARAQSLPGAGEEPQAFETGGALDARAEWNALRPRQSVPATPAAGAGGSLYLATTATDLAPNDMLVLVTDGGPAALRVGSVHPEPDADRTRVDLQPDAPASAGMLARVIGRYIDPQDHGVSPRREMARRVVDLLDRLSKQVKPDMDVEPLVELVERVLGELHKEYDLAVAGGYSRLQHWVGMIVRDLERFAARRQAPTLAAAPHVPAAPAPTSFDLLEPLLSQLLEPPSEPPESHLELDGRISEQLGSDGDATLKLLTALSPALAPTLAHALEQTPDTLPPTFEVHALRISASLFGHAVSKQVKYEKDGRPKVPSKWLEWDPEPDERDDLVYLDGPYERIVAPSYAVIQKPVVADEETPEPTVHTVFQATIGPRTAYALPGQTTRLEVKPAWWRPKRPQEDGDDLEGEPFAVIRGTVAHAASEQLELAQTPLVKPVKGHRIVLDGLFAGLEPGRWAIVSGERLLESAIPDGPVTRVPASELVMVAAVKHDPDPDYPGDTPHTTLVLARPLAYAYARETVAIAANVVEATHGESRTEVLGSGDASVPLQRFVLREPPLTHVAAATPSGVERALRVEVNDVRWQEAPDAGALGPTDHGYIVDIDPEGETTIQFGDGVRGARLPSGTENATAIYRSGIGVSGNVRQGQISQLVTKPLGVKGVTNPLGASGGADPDDRDHARQNAPRSVTALDRLVSLRDYEDFARTFAGIGKARTVRMPTSAGPLVHVTVAGAGDIPVARSSSLFRNLLRSLRRFGDPSIPLALDVRELVVLVIGAGVRVDPARRWETVEPAVRAALLEAFSFDRRDLGQDALLSEVVGAIQGVAGVAFADVDALISVRELEPEPGLLRLQQPGPPPESIPVYPPAGTDTPPGRGVIAPAQLAILSPRVPESLLLREIR